MIQTLETLGEGREPGPTGGPGGPASGVPRRDPERTSIQSVDRALTLLESSRTKERSILILSKGNIRR